MQNSYLPRQSPNETNSDLVVVATGTLEHLTTCSLVLDAVGIPNKIDITGSSLIVPQQLALEAEYHINSYFEENINWPERPETPSQTLYQQRQPTLLLMGSLAIFYGITGPWTEHNLWFNNGAIDSLAILKNNEWWRLVTALTLHADLLHLAGNCIIGGFLVYLLTAQLGPGIALTLLIASGTVGNFLNIVARETVHHSVGFSTAIFGVIGLFSGTQIFAGKSFRLKNLLIPLGAGAGLLAMLGAEGERTDLGAHLFGFLCGILLGITTRFFPIERLTGNDRLQRNLFFLSVGIIIFCWLLAMK